MVTSNSSSVWLPVRFRAPAPIFLIPVIIALMCVSADAIQLEEDHSYSFSVFPYYYHTSNSYTANFQGYASNAFSGTSQYKNVLLPASGNGSGTLNANGYPLSYFDVPLPHTRFLRVGFRVPRSDAIIGLTQSSVAVRVFFTSVTGVTASPITCTGSFDSSGYLAHFTESTPGLATVYASSVVEYDGFVSFNFYISVGQDEYLSGFQSQINRSYFNISNSSTSWDFPFDNFSFELSNTKILPPNDSSGSVDLSGITSQINSLSAQMTSSFQQVNANIDSAESAISSAISDQTTELTGAIEGAADSVNDHFDDWDASLSGAFSSADAAAVVAADQAVSELHQIESDQIDDTGQALDDTGLSGYSMPSDYDDGLAAIGQMFTLFFDSLSFITPLVIFSCTLGLASVLVGRKSKSDSGG